MKHGNWVSHFLHQRHKRINLTDPEARLMKGRQGIVAGYSAQAMVSPMETDGRATGMLVTAVDVVDAANDNACWCR